MRNKHLVRIWAEYADRLVAVENDSMYWNKGGFFYIDLLYMQDGRRWA